MKEYYYSDGQNHLGPFKPEDLKEKKISKETLVWCEGMKDWVKAQDVDELKFLFVSVPPPIKKVVPPLLSTSVSNNKTVGIKSKNKTTRNIIIICISVTIVVVAAILLFNHFNSNDDSNSSSNSSGSTNPNNSPKIEQQNQKSETELKTDLKETEKSNPLKYLSVTGQWKLNFVNETVIEGDIFNNATLATFKDIKIKVDFLSKTGTTLGTDYFTIYEFVYPGRSVHFKQKFSYSYKNGKSLSCSVIDAGVS